MLTLKALSMRPGTLCKGSAIGERFQRFAPISNWDPKVVASLQPLG